jgi:hypothetical protein
MLALIGTIIGLIGSFIPELLKWVNNKEDHKHELAVLKVQAEMAKSEHVYRLEEISSQADVASEQAVYQAAELKPTGVRWADALLGLYNGTVRPTITYVFLALFCLVKVAQYKVLTAAGTTMWNTVWQLWSADDMAVFSTILAFYFGGRFMKYALGRPGNGNGIKTTHSQPALKPEVKPDAPKGVTKPVIERDGAYAPLTPRTPEGF